MMLKIALTGSIGMGKSTTLNFFKTQGIVSFDADQAVHYIYNVNPPQIMLDTYKAAVVDQKIDRQKLADIIIKTPEKLKYIEQIIHPLVEKMFNDFALKNKNSTIIMNDVPLLFENNKQDDYDITILVSASEKVQTQRVLMRENMTIEKFDLIKKRQMSDDAKRKKSHFIILTDFGFDKAEAQVKSLRRSLAYIQSPFMETINA
jgi:dephospho-CoA kinase